MRAASFLFGFLFAAACCAREPEAVYAEPARCIEIDCADQRPGWDAGIHVQDASCAGDADYMRRF